MTFELLTAIIDFIKQFGRNKLEFAKDHGINVDNLYMLTP